MTDEMLSKIPAVTLGFWIIKILATTLGETGGDTVTMTDKPIDAGGLALSRPAASLALGIAMLALILLLPQRAGAHPKASS